MEYVVKLLTAIAAISAMVLKRSSRRPKRVRMQETSAITPSGSSSGTSIFASVSSVVLGGCSFFCMLALLFYSFAPLDRPVRLGDVAFMAMLATTALVSYHEAWRQTR